MLIFQNQISFFRKQVTESFKSMIINWIFKYVGDVTQWYFKDIILGMNLRLKQVLRENEAISVGPACKDWLTIGSASSHSSRAKGQGLNLAAGRAITAD